MTLSLQIRSQIGKKTNLHLRKSDWAAINWSCYLPRVEQVYPCWRQRKMFLSAAQLLKKILLFGRSFFEVTRFIHWTFELSFDLYEDLWNRSLRLCSFSIHSLIRFPLISTPPANWTRDMSERREKERDTSVLQRRPISCLSAVQNRSFTRVGGVKNTACARRHVSGTTRCTNTRSTLSHHLPLWFLRSGTQRLRLRTEMFSTIVCSF